MNNYLSRPRPALLGMALLLILSASSWAASPTAFTYQGRLNADGGAANGQYDFEFRLFAAETNGAALAGPASASGLWVTNGAFLAVIDFGSGAFTGEGRWLEIAVQCTACDGLPVTLSPRQALTATPQALFALNAGGLMSYAGAPLDITLNGERVMRFQPATSPTLGFMPNIIGGAGSQVTTQNHGVTVAGGGFHDVEDESYFSTVSGGLSNWLARGTAFSVIGGGNGNQIQTPVGRPIRSAAIVGGRENLINSADYASIGGGRTNVIQLGSLGAVIGGGEANRMDVWCAYAVIAGGGSNFLQWYADGSTISGGVQNRVLEDARYSVIGGGLRNAIGRQSFRSTIAGGQMNQVDSYAQDSAIGGGSGNRVGLDAIASVISGGESNQVNGSHGTVSGGAGNLIQPNTFNATIGGGSGNHVEARAENSTIGGGTGNEIRSSGVRQVRNGTIAGGGSNIIENGADHATVGGGSGNLVNHYAKGALIAGGRDNTISDWCTDSVISGGSGNYMGIWYAIGAVISGGVSNRVGKDSFYSTIGGGAGNFGGHISSGVTVGGGLGNSVGSQTWAASIGGGASNVIRGPGTAGATIAGGYGNRIAPVASSATIGGGSGNTIGRFESSEITEPFGTCAVISGGLSNRAIAPYSTVAGGRFNVTAGTNSFAAGFRAQATNDGTFVWADLQEADFTSTGTNQFLIRASGGVGIGTDSPQFDLHVNGTAGKPGGGAWTVASDARLKKDIRPLEQALARLLKLHGVTYEYKDAQAIHELPGQQTGMIAQEVEKVFPEWVESGRDGMKRLSVRGFEALTVEALRELRTEKDEQIRARDAQIDSMEKRLAALERMISDRKSPASNEL